MKKMSVVRFVCIGGILTTAAVLFQSAPVFLPMIGMALSPLSTLPIAIAAVSSIPLGFTVFFASAFILAVVSVQETVILIFTTGLFGIVIGTLLYRKGMVLSIFISSMALSLGIGFLTYIIGIPSFVEIAGQFSIPLAFLIFFSFSLAYAIIWHIGLKKLTNYLMKFIS